MPIPDMLRRKLQYAAKWSNEVTLSPDEVRTLLLGEKPPEFMECDVCGAVVRTISAVSQAKEKFPWDTLDEHKDDCVWARELRKLDAYVTEDD